MARTLPLAALLVLVAVRPAEAQSLDGPADVREASHRIDVSLEAGIAAVEEQLALTRTGPGRAEVEIELPLPPSATLVSIRICRAGHCRRLLDPGTHAASEAYVFSLYLPPRGGARAPIGSASSTPRGVGLRVAPVDAATPLTVRLRYAAPLVIHEGVARLTLPAVGADARRAPIDVALGSADLEGLSVGGVGARATLAAGAPIEIEGHVGAAIATLYTRRGSSRAFAVAPRVTTPHDVIVALDVSPSMQDVPAGRLEAALAGVLAALPPGSRVRVLRFGARAEWVSPDGQLPAWTAPTDVVVHDAVDVAYGALGSRTLYGPIATRVDEALVDTPVPLLVVLGDGMLSGADFAPLVGAGGRTVVVDVGDEPLAAEVTRAAARAPTTLALTLGPTLAGADGPPLSIVVAEPSSAEVRGGGASARAITVASGEPFELVAAAPLSLAWGGAAVPVEGASWSVLPRALAPVTVAVDPRIWGDVAKLDEGGPAPRRVPGGVAVDDGLTGAPRFSTSADGSGRSAPRRMVAPRIVCPAPAVMAAPPARMIGRTLARALRPRVRGCFASARHGRPSWSARADVQLLVAHREVLAAAVSGPNVDAALAACILRGVDDLQVPPSDTPIQITYPFRTDPVVPVAPEPLDADVRGTLETLFGPPAPLPASPDGLQRGTP